MIKQTPLLSICIPTYQREIELEKTLEALLKAREVLNLESVVEICVSAHSCSSYKLKILKKAAKKRLTKIAVHSGFLTFDQNTEHAFQMATGTYRWFLGDDDFITLDGMKNVVSFLKEQRSRKVHAIIVEGLNIKSSADWNFPSFRSYESIKIENLSELGRRTANRIGFLSAIILHKEAQNILGNMPENIKSSLFFHTALFLSYLLTIPHLNVFFLQKLAFFTYLDEAREIYPRFIRERLIVNEKNLSTLFKDLLPPQETRIFQRKIIKNFAAYLLKDKLFCSDTLFYWKIFFRYWKLKESYKYVLPLILFPKKLLSFIFFIKKHSK